MPEIEVGAQAPGFTLPDHTGAMVALADACAKGPVVVFFYPRDETLLCTQQVCAFRDRIGEFRAAGATVLGISADSVEQHARFAASRALSYALLSDADNAVRRAYGVRATMGILPGRVTFVIDAHGTVQHRCIGQLGVGRHIDEAAEVVHRLHAAAR